MKALKRLFKTGIGHREIPDIHARAFDQKAGKQEIPLDQLASARERPDGARLWLADKAGCGRARPARAAARRFSAVTSFADDWELSLLMLAAQKPFCRGWGPRYRGDTPLSPV